VIAQFRVLDEGIQKEICCLVLVGANQDLIIASLSEHFEDNETQSAGFS
jgi:hypothetical protein